MLLQNILVIEEIGFFPIIGGIFADKLENLIVSRILFKIDAIISKSPLKMFAFNFSVRGFKSP